MALPLVSSPFTFTISIDAALSIALMLRRSPFTTQSCLREGHKGQPAASKADGKGSAAEESSAQNPSFETNFAGLGLSRGMKIFLIVVVGIFGTMETWMYCKAMWRWWKGEGKKAE
ncbi:hypothetical protein RJ55_03120 [Drechmeria coniospora]|nr:hypothetical protein RJ55_03120 [Drechmeria coniospora]